MPWRPGAHAPLDIATPPPPPIPFNAGKPLQHMPPSLSFGFGCGNAFSAPPNPPAEPIAGPSAWRAPDACSARTGMQKRRRSSPEEDESIEETPVADDDMDMATSPLLSKRRRASSGRMSDETRVRPQRTPQRAQGAEVGKLLGMSNDADAASLDKPALLSVLHQLMQGSDELTERIYTLLPTPSLESVEHALDAAEAKIRASLPLASANSAAPIRDQYVWSRVRTSLAELAADVASYSSLFSMHNARNESLHPATTFSFLFMTTQRMIRLLRLLPHAEQTSGLVSKKGDERLDTLFENALPGGGKNSPNTIVYTILPSLLRDWNYWLRVVDHAVNDEGRMYGQEVVMGWERGLASLGLSSPTLGAPRSAEEQALRATLDHAATQMHTALGWLTGPPNRPVWSFAPVHAMEEAGCCL